MASDWRYDDDRFGYVEDRDRWRERGRQDDLGWSGRRRREGYESDFGRERDMRFGRSDAERDRRRADFGRGDYGRGDYGRSDADWMRIYPESEQFPTYAYGRGWSASSAEPSGPGYWRDYGYGYGGDYADPWTGPYGRSKDYRDRGWRDDRSPYGRGAGWRGQERSFWDRASDEVSSWFGDEDAERRRLEDMRRGGRGRGPKGYIRSDERIREDVSDALTVDWRLDASDIEVSVSGGEVTLSGFVDDRHAKRRAEDCADRVLGVKHVQNNLRVRDPAGAGSRVSEFGGGGVSTASAGSTNLSAPSSGSKQKV